MLVEFADELGKFVQQSVAEGRALRNVARRVLNFLLQVGRVSIDQFLVLDSLISFDCIRIQR